MLPATLEKFKKIVKWDYKDVIHKDAFYTLGHIEGQIKLAREILKMEGFEEEKEKEQ